MKVIAAQIAPQRSTQYSDWVRQLAPHEMMLSSFGRRMHGDIRPITLGGQDFLLVDSEPVSELETLLGELSLTNAYFEYLPRIGEKEGPFLKPLETPANRFLPTSLVATRRYRGKTNELFTHFMCNLARYSSGFASKPWSKLTLLDPLSGGGTTLFVGLMLGADVVGVEHNRKVVDGTVAFLRRYVKEGRISATFREEKLKGIGRRWFVNFQKNARCVIGLGDTSDVKHFAHGLKKTQLIVTDVPYDIQHRSEWKAMLVSALPAWAEVLDSEGALVFSWDATRFQREEMITLVQEMSPFTVINDPPYNRLAHGVDRVIKQRDVIVARL